MKHSLSRRETTIILAQKKKQKPMRIIIKSLEPSIEGDFISIVKKLPLVNNIWSVKDHQIPGGILPTGKGKPGRSIDNKNGPYDAAGFFSSP